MTGWEIPTESYSDQPYVVETDSGEWLCVLTTGVGEEGSGGQHVIAVRSSDNGRTWSDPVDVESAHGPEASYAVLLKVPSGRIYCFYNYNADNIREVIADDPPFDGGVNKRVDTLGYFVFKYTDDGGRTWSDKRWTIPVRETEIDRRNPYKGKIRFHWNVGRAFLDEGIAYVPLHKVGGFGSGFITSNEGFLLKSENLAAVTDPDAAVWETLPDGEHGLRTPPGGSLISGEHSFSVLSDGSFYCVYRTIDGYPVCAYSRDKGHTWETPAYKQYADGRRMKHPRAANFAWKCRNGKFLYWFHNHGGHFIREMKSLTGMGPYDDRNPVWVSGGLEADGPTGRVIKWTQPEILFYDDDPFIRMSYPDLIEKDGNYYITETQKDKGRIHEVPADFFEALWNQFHNRNLTANGLLLDLPENGEALTGHVKMPELPLFNERDNETPDYRTKNLRQGFSMDMWVRFDSLAPGSILLDTTTETGKGLRLELTRRGTLEILMNDGRMENRWDSDPVFETGRLHHIAIIVDAGPRIISFIIDGKFCDGGEYRQFGWGRFSMNLRDARGGEFLRIAPEFDGHIRKLRIYDRALTTSEAIGNYNAEKGLYADDEIAAQAHA